MSKFNKSVNNKTENLAGGEAYIESPKMRLISILLTSFVKDQYYRSEEQGIADLEKAYNEILDKKFIGKATIYARTKFGMRSITHIISALIAKTEKGAGWTKKYFEKIIHRVDDMTEILSYYLSKFKKPIPNSLKKGFKKAFNKFDKYQLAKYRGEGKTLKLIDIVNLIHPKPVEKNAEALKLLVNGELRSEKTWESKLTKAGQKAETSEEKEELKSQAWKELILERRIGYFALLKNLRNIIEQAPDVLEQALELLIEEKLIKKSLVLPFRFTTAYHEIQSLDKSIARKVMIAISKAVDISLSNVPKFSGDTLVVCDYSGSMGEGLKSNRGMGTLFGAVLAKANDSDFMIFGDSAEYINFNSLDTTISIVNSTNKLNDGEWGCSGKGKGQVGHGTNFRAIFHAANKKYDRIIIFSDMQGWVGYRAPTSDFNVYKKKYNCNPYIYSVDLAGYGTLQFPENNIFCLAGFSDKIFNIMELLEQDKDALIKEIEKIEL